MDKYSRRQDISSARKRMSELRERHKPSVADSIRRSRTTIFINMLIELFSGILYAVGLYIAIRFLNLRKPFMEPIQYKVFIGAFTVISCGWFSYLLIKMYGNLKRFRRISSMQD